MRVDVCGEPERLAPSDREQSMASWSSQGVIAFLVPDDSGNRDIWVLPPDEDPTPFFTSEGEETHETFSPDGKWLAYSAPGGIYVRPYPGPEPATLIADDGHNPTWSPDGRQIYYGRRGVLMAVDVSPGGDELQAGRAARLIDLSIGGFAPARRYDVFTDGSFVTAVVLDYDRSPLERLGATEFHVILNFFEELKARVGN